MSTKTNKHWDSIQYLKKNISGTEGQTDGRNEHIALPIPSGLLVVARKLIDMWGEHIDISGELINISGEFIDVGKYFGRTDTDIYRVRCSSGMSLIL